MSVRFFSKNINAHPFAFASLKRGFGETQSALSSVAFAKTDEAEIFGIKQDSLRFD